MNIAICVIVGYLYFLIGSGFWIHLEDMPTCKRLMLSSTWPVGVGLLLAMLCERERKRLIAIKEKKA